MWNCASKLVIEQKGSIFSFFIIPTDYEYAQQAENKPTQ